MRVGAATETMLLVQMMRWGMIEEETAGLVEEGEEEGQIDLWAEMALETLVSLLIMIHLMGEGEEVFEVHPVAVEGEEVSEAHPVAVGGEEVFEAHPAAAGEAEVEEGLNQEEVRGR